jgi:hypothetical protein
MHSRRPETIGAWLLLVASLTGTFGLVWDIQWHSDVGPDTFFTVPHLVLYLGMATTGLTSLAVVLYRTFRNQDTSVRTVNVLGRFRAPVPFLITGLAAAGGLLYGLTDLWWHTVYGFDATPTSPPHVAMSLCGAVESVGGVIAFASLRDKLSGRIGLALYLGLISYSNVFLLFSTPELPLVAAVPLAIVLLGVLGMILSGAVTRSPVYVVVTGLAYAAIQALSWVVAPAVTRAYAAAIDLPLRDFVDGTAFYPSLTPFVILPVALLVAGAMAVSKRISSPQIAVPIIGAFAAALTALGFLAQLGAMGIGTVVGAAVLGLAIGWLGWRLAAPLRTQVEV